MSLLTVPYHLGDRLEPFDLGVRAGRAQRSARGWLVA
jgi:hypothetical protein